MPSISRKAEKRMRLCCKVGWVDAIRRIHPEKGVYTYWNFSYRGGQDRSSRLRMDHLLINPSLAANSEAPAWMSKHVAGRSRATTLRPGSRSRHEERGRANRVIGP